MVLVVVSGEGDCRNGENEDGIGSEFSVAQSRFYGTPAFPSVELLICFDLLSHSVLVIPVTAPTPSLPHFLSSYLLESCQTYSLSNQTARFTNMGEGL